MIKDSNDILRILNSLSYVLWENADEGNLEPETAADTMELFTWLIELAIGLKSKEEREAVTV